MALGGRESTMSHKKQLNSRGADGEGLGEDARPAGNAGERYLIVLGAIKVGGERKYYKIDAFIKLIIFLTSLSI